jgi:hypothetical protein
MESSPLLLWEPPVNEEKNPGTDTPIRLSGTSAVLPPAAPAPIDATRPTVLSQAPPIASGETKPVVDEPTTIVAAPVPEKK